jgi:hypothetical protein
MLIFLKSKWNNLNLFKKKFIYDIKFPVFKHFCFVEDKLKSDKIEDEKKDELLSNLVNYKELKISKLSFNILKYLEKNYELYTRLCEDCVKLSYELSDASEGTDFLKNELIRINRQISTFSRENYYHDEFSNLIRELISTNELIKEAIDLGEDEIKISAQFDFKNLQNKIEELQNEIIEYLIPDDNVLIN